jgi:hypothetical protein
MKLIFTTIILLIWYGNIYSQDIKKKHTIPASISNVESICIQKNDYSIKEFPPRAVMLPATITWTIELLFDIDITDTSFGRSVPYDIAGILPDGKIFRKTIQLNSNEPPLERLILREQVTIKKLGWADFILTTNNTPSQLNLYNYDIRSNKYSVSINCDN